MSMPSFGGSSDPSLKVQIDFNQQPAESNAELDECLSQMASALNSLNSYEPKPAPIREAISKPNDYDVSVATVVALISNVDLVAGWMVLADRVAGQLQSLSEHIAQNTPRATMGGTTIADFPADTANLAKMLHFCWKFDQGKMMQPGIQNDFAGYRRVVGKVQMDQVPGMKVDEAATGTISMWIADMSPFTGKAVASVASAPKRAVLAALANCCCGMLGRIGGVAGGGGTGGAPPEVGSVQWLLEVMVACLVFYDRASVGSSVFTSKDIQIRKCIAVIKKQGGPGRDSLINSLKYSTLNYNDAPAAIQNSLE